MSYTTDGLDMGHVMDQGTKYARQCEASSWTKKDAQGWRDMRWDRLDKEIEWAKARRWTP